MLSSKNGIKNAITSNQIRAARALLEWSREKLSELSGVPMRTLARVESNETAPRARTMTAIRVTLERAGVRFIRENGGGPGVRLRA